MALLPYPNQEIHHEKLQTGKLGPGLLKKWNLPISVFPESEESLVCRPGFCGISGITQGASQLDPGGRADGVGQQESGMVQHSLELRAGFAGFVELLIRQASDLGRVERAVVYRNANRRLCQFISFGYGQEFDGFCGVALIHGE
jgi:hypothetical protein